VKTIQKQLLPHLGGHGSLCLQPGAKIVGINHEGGQIHAYIEGHQSGGGYVYWDVQVVRENDSYSDGMEVLGSFLDPNSPAGYSPLHFVIGRING
jgi:hypothetical protein